MLIKAKAKLLSAESKPYDFDGRSGVSSKARFLVEDSIIPLKTTELYVKDLKNSLNKDGEVEFALNSRKETVTLELVSFEPKK